MAVIELHQVRAGYGKHTVLQDVSLSLEKGSLTSIIGINGCGKSTLLKTILGMAPAQSGGIRVDGSDLRAMTPVEIARKIAYLPQGKDTPDMTVAQMVLHGRFPHLSYPRRYRPEDHRIAQEAMARLGISHLAQRPLRTLSGGMRQTAYIAMALAQGADYMLLDEPATYLDVGHQLALMRTLQSLAEAGNGIVAVMHDLPMAFTFSNRVILLHDGRIAADDTPQRLCQRQEIQEIFGVAIRRQEDSRGSFYSCIF